MKKIALFIFNKLKKTTNKKLTTIKQQIYNKHLNGLNVFKFRADE